MEKHNHEVMSRTKPHFSRIHPALSMPWPGVMTLPMGDVELRIAQVTATAMRVRMLATTLDSGPTLRVREGSRSWSTSQTKPTSTRRCIGMACASTTARRNTRRKATIPVGGTFTYKIESRIPLSTGTPAHREDPPGMGCTGTPRVPADPDMAAGEPRVLLTLVTSDRDGRSPGGRGRRRRGEGRFGTDAVGGRRTSLTAALGRSFIPDQHREQPVSHVAVPVRMSWSAGDRGRYEGDASSTRCFWRRSGS